MAYEDGAACGAATGGVKKTPASDATLKRFGRTPRAGEEDALGLRQPKVRDELVEHSTDNGLASRPQHLRAGAPMGRSQVG